jgi:hypothetical protein
MDYDTFIGTNINDLLAYLDTTDNAVLLQCLNLTPEEQALIVDRTVTTIPLRVPAIIYYGQTRTITKQLREFQLVKAKD